MPHYSDGAQAVLGDMVKGKPYNTPHEVTGVVVGLVPDSDSCNLRVAFTKPTAWPADHDSHQPPPLGKVILCSGYDAEGRHQAVMVEVDYGETRAFTKIG